VRVRLAHVLVFPNVSGRGRAIKEHAGNVRFHALVASYLHAYASAPTKSKKSLIILKILNEIRCHHDANFVKFDATIGQYLPVEESAARVTIAQALRDELSQGYKSSKEHKQRRRLFQKRTTAFTACTQAQACRLMTNTAVNADRNMSLVSTFREFQLLSRSMATMEVNNPFPLASIINNVIHIADETQSAFHANEGTEANDVFSSLFKAFGNHVTPQCLEFVNPFEPTPIAEGRPLEVESDVDVFCSLLFDDLEPLPLAI
jgi:ribulose bisphosphate carboxylase small subunit